MINRNRRAYRVLFWLLLPILVIAFLYSPSFNAGFFLVIFALGTWPVTYGKISQAEQDDPISLQAKGKIFSPDDDATSKLSFSNGLFIGVSSLFIPMSIALVMNASDKWERLIYFVMFGFLGLLFSFGVLMLFKSLPR